MTRVVVSIVSHGQNALARPLVEQLVRCPDVFKVLLTCNIPDADRVAPSSRLHVIENATPKGFSANHNAAFRRAAHLFAQAPLFCILNPDITLNGNPFPQLAQHLEAPGVGLVAPQILTPTGDVEDSARDFPTLINLSRKLFGFEEANHSDGRDPVSRPDWVAGMFLLLKARTFSRVGGFDEKFHLYYEDVDLCARLRCASKDIILDTRVSVVHDARRDSRRDLRYLRWHVSSMSRYFVKRWLQPHAYCGKGRTSI